MSLTLADQYYLKAKDNYPWDLNEAQENLNYALSYDDEHVAANCLMARFCLEQFNDCNRAASHYRAALGFDPENGRIYLEYAYVLLIAKKIAEAKKVLKYAKGLKNIEQGPMLRMWGLFFEYQKKFSKAKAAFQKAKLESYDPEYIAFLDEDSKRAGNKMKMTKEFLSLSGKKKRKKK